MTYPLLNNNALRDRIGRLYATLYWDSFHRHLLSKGKHKREDLFGIKDREDRKSIRREYRCRQKQLANNEWTDEMNERGNIIIRNHDPSADRYKYDFGLKGGWKQYDTSQDASYFGVWVHLERRHILTYCEGDVTLVKCPTLETFKAELDSMAEFYGDPPPALIACDGIGVCDGKFVPEGNVVGYFDERP